MEWLSKFPSAVWRQEIYIASDNSMQFTETHIDDSAQGWCHFAFNN